MLPLLPMKQGKTKRTLNPGFNSNGLAELELHRGAGNCFGLRRQDRSKRLDA